MKLSRKTFIYALTFVSVLLLLIIGYFVLLLPSLYVDYTKKSDGYKITHIQRQFIKERNYEHIKVKNPTNTFSFVIPSVGNKIMVHNQLISFDLTLNDEKIKQLLEDVREYVSSYEDNEDSKDSKSEKKKLNIDEDYIVQLIKKLGNFDANSPIMISNISTKNVQPIKQLSMRYRLVEDDMVLSQWEGTDGINYYTNYMTFSIVDHDLIITFLMTMTPNMSEIRPIVMQSLPMIIVVTTLLVFAVTRILSKQIVTPIEKLANHARYVRQSGVLEEETEIAKGTDEIAILSQSLNQLYGELNDNYTKLENSNQLLREQNVRQEVFLRSSSHQLKTPITAALLLVDGIIHKVGRYLDRDKYLPEVKEQILSMKKIVDDILYLRHCEDDLKIEDLDIEQIVTVVLKQFEIQLDEKSMTVKKVCTDQNGMVIPVKLGYTQEIKGDFEMVKKIIENVISNAISYGNSGSEILVRYKKNAIYIRNCCDGIDTKLLPTVFEPFVTSNHKEKGHGLGLYVVQYYCKLLGYVANIYNTDDGVEIMIEFV